MPKISSKSSTKVLERIRSGLAGYTITVTVGQPLHVTASFGATKLRADKSGLENIEIADQALYDAKSGGRNRVVFH